MTYSFNHRITKNGAILSVNIFHCINNCIQRTSNDLGRVNGPEILRNYEYAADQKKPFVFEKVFV